MNAVAVHAPGMLDIGIGGLWVRLQTDSQALQISYASLSKITQLSLLNYL